MSRQQLECRKFNKKIQDIAFEKVEEMYYSKRQWKVKTLREFCHLYYPQQNSQYSK